MRVFAAVFTVVALTGCQASSEAPQLIEYYQGPRAGPVGGRTRAQPQPAPKVEAPPPLPDDTAARLQAIRDRVQALRKRLNLPPAERVSGEAY